MRAWVLAGVATLCGVAFIGVLEIPGLGETPTLLISNGGQLLAAVLASAGCATAARRTHHQRRKAWAWLSAGTGAWAAGQAVWSFYEVVLDRPVPFPSLADVGFLLFPLLAAVGLVTWLGSQTDELVARGRDVLDGLIIAGSLLVISWVTALGSVVAEGGDGWVPLTLSLAYPIGDLVLATLVLLALARGARTERATLFVLALGLGGLAAADSAYVYLVSLEAYTSADTISTGWVIGFLLVGAAGMTVRPIGDDAPRRHAEHRPTVLPVPSVLGMALPYVPLLGAVVALIANRVNGARTPTMNLVLGATLIVVVLVRQFLAMTDNRRLMLALGEARDQLEHQALHDALTGLANRVLFADRLDRALLQPGASVSVLFCDLDDFKLVNDERGHEAGDVLLREVAQRLLECVRATDTVARLGGDEFAILLEDSADAAHVADRVVSAMGQPVPVGGRDVRTSISVGVAHHEGGDVLADERREPGRRTGQAGGTVPATHRETTAQLLLRTADSAMYAAKGAGKSRAVLAEEPVSAGS
jgi:diguanylate cyclase (GGDEF)-like protein